MKSPGTLEWNRACLAVEWRGDSWRGLRGERSHGQLRWVPANPGDAAWAAAVDRRVPVVACLSVRECLVRWIEAPLASASKAARVLPALLDVQLPFDLEDCAYTFLDSHRHGEGTRALAAAARFPDIEKRLAAFSEKGIDPVVLDHEGLALWTQGLAEFPVSVEAAGRLRVLVNLEGDQSCLVIGRGEDFINAHGVKSGDMGQLLRLLRPHAAPAAAAEGAPAGSPRRVDWIWTGSGALDADDVKRRQVALATDWPGSFKSAEAPDRFLLRALASRALLPGPLRCNLRLGRLEHPRWTQKQDRRRRLALVYLLLGGLLLALTGLGSEWVARRHEVLLDAEFQTAANAAAGFEVQAKGEHALRIVREQVQKRRAAIQPCLSRFDESLMVRIGELVAVARAENVNLDRLSVSRGAVELTGESKAWSGGDRLAQHLRSAGYRTKTDRKDEGGESGTPFSVTAEAEP